jgi:hypothetical protein
MRAMSTIARVLVLAATMLGCNSPPEQPDRDPPPRPPPPPRSSAAAMSAAAPAATLPITGEIATATASAQEPDDLAGTWEGRYDAKKGKLTLSPRVKDKAFDADEGKTAVGPGSIEITITAKGDIHGKMSGALGPGAISGRVDGAILRAAVRPPDDALGGNAMSGTFMGERKGDALSFVLRVAGPDATVIRESTVELKRKK